MPEILTHRGLPVSVSGWQGFPEIWGKGVCSPPLPTLAHVPNALKDKEPEPGLQTYNVSCGLSPSTPLPDQEHFRDITVYSFSNKFKHLMKPLVLCSE